jgi:hypothetical protein
LQAGFRRVAITDDDAEGFTTAGPELYEEPVPQGHEHEHEQHDSQLDGEVNLLLARGMSVTKIAAYLEISEAAVSAADRSPEDDDDFRQTPAEAYGLEPDHE